MGEVALELDPAADGAALAADAAEQAQRGKQGRRAEAADGDAGGVGAGLGLPRDPGEITERGVGLKLEAHVIGAALAGLIDRQIPDDCAGRSLVEEVGEVAAVERGAKLDRAAVAHGGFEAEAPFEPEVRVADLEAGVAAVGAVGEQFVDRRRALAAGEVEAELPIARDGVGRAGRQRQAGEAAGEVGVADDRAGAGGQRRALDPRPGLEPERAAVDMLEREQAPATGLGRREILLVALDTAVEVDKLHAAGAAPLVAIALDQFDARLAAFLEDMRPGGAVGTDLEMVVVRVTGAGLDLAEQAAERNFGAGVVAGLVDVDVGAFGVDGGVE